VWPTIRKSPIPLPTTTSSTVYIYTSLGRIGVPQGLDRVGIPDGAAVLLQVVSLRPLVALTHFPQLDRFVLKEEIRNNYLIQEIIIALCSVGDPDLDGFGPPGSGFVSQRAGSGSIPFLIKVLSGLK
jgi:hypothetical protein